MVITLLLVPRLPWSPHTAGLRVRLATAHCTQCNGGPRSGSHLRHRTSTGGQAGTLRHTLRWCRAPRAAELAVGKGAYLMSRATTCSNPQGKERNREGRKKLGFIIAGSQSPSTTHVHAASISHRGFSGSGKKCEVATQAGGIMERPSKK